MAASEGLGIIGVDNFHYFVSDETRSEAALHRALRVASRGPIV